jgi:CelD/BcsL family acetyltransferase involved in cellulose biosynthesis
VGVVHAFLKWFRSKQWDLCHLNCLSPRSVVASLLLRELRNNSWEFASHEQPCVTVPLPRTWELYLKQLSSKERGKLGNRTRRLETRRQLRFYKCQNLEELPRCLDTLFLLHQKRWEKRDESGSFSLPLRRQFYDEMARLLLLRNRLELWFLELDGQTVASQIALRYGNTVNSLQEGFDPAYASDSVGYVLRGHVLRQCIAAGVDRYEFLGGDQDSKQRWGAEIGSYTDLHFARPGSMGVLHLQVAEGILATKRWLHAHLPARAVEMLRSLRMRSEPGVGNGTDLTAASGKDSAHGES